MAHDDNAIQTSSVEPGRLRARPRNCALGSDAQCGLRALGLGDRRDGLLYIPTSHRAGRPSPLIVVLHGAGGSARQGIDLLRVIADNAGAIVVAPDSRTRTWDVLVNDYGPDVAFIDRTLARVFRHYAVDPARIAVAGFSDGASYALSLGLTNGDLFHSVIAFSPGFSAPAATRGAPRVFVSHGIADAVLPIDRCSRRIVPRLQRSGYAVQYREFQGAHAVPGDIAVEAVRWFLVAGEASQDAIQGSG